MSEKATFLADSLAVIRGVRKSCQYNYHDGNGKTVQLEIWDTAGQERFGALTTSVYHKTRGFIVVHDISNDNSFNNVRRWLHDIDQHCDIPNPTRILVGNKCDLPEVMRVVAREDAVMFATKIGIQLFETSATENNNIEDV
ncbi:ras-related protein Rab-35-like [Corticium candelabrum]|uniref:ras-related protein Rab-35-like n=1 Tax=Corticium candelabrum TaxID=121492 RepID=UPI002E26DCB6|nr:ras-related protein Rab-35-like [Corticium candelabrum]